MRTRVPLLETCLHSPSAARRGGSTEETAGEGTDCPQGRDVVCRTALSCRRRMTWGQGGVCFLGGRLYRRRSLSRAKIAARLACFLKGKGRCRHDGFPANLVDFSTFQLYISTGPRFSWFDLLTRVVPVRNQQASINGIGGLFHTLARSPQTAFTPHLADVGDILRGYKRS